MTSKFRQNLNTWGSIIFGCLIAFGALKTVYEKFASNTETNSQTEAAPQNAVAATADKTPQELNSQKPTARSLEEWATYLQGKNPDSVISLLGRPDGAQEKKNDMNVVQWTIFEYRDLVANKYTGKTEKLSVAFMYGGRARMVKEGYGKEIDVQP